MFYRALRRLGVLRKVDPKMYHTAPTSADDAINLQYLGTAGFVITSAERTVVIDPYVTRPGGRTTLTRRLVPDAGLIRRTIPKADDVLVGHAHHDHVLDAPELCRQTGARLIGSRAVANVGLAAGLPRSQIVETAGGETIPCGPALVRGLRSRHGRVYFNRVTLAGDIADPPPWPPYFRDLRHGLVLNWHVEIAGLTVVHVDSADIIEEELAGNRCDILCLCAIGRKYRPNYVADAVRLLQPKVVIPCHWDLFTTALHIEPFLLPDVDIEGMLQEIREAGSRPVLLPFFGNYGASPGRIP
jgi:L-ascorbate metabolism protein UlaG (beta-lactamase superfamily)